MMKLSKSVWCSWLGGILALAAVPPSARANVYATDIRLNGGTTNVNLPAAGSVSISYILNEPASLGATINILNGTSVVRALALPAGSPGTLLGTNSVTWDGTDGNSNNVPNGVYSISITAASSGYTNWTQITTDTNAGNYVFYGTGIAVDRNPASPYYGRVFVANAIEGPNPETNPGDVNGVLILNADGSPADESPTNWCQTGGLDWMNDGFAPWKIEVSGDDHVYISDLSTSGGLVYRWDPLLSTNSQLLVLDTNNWGAGGGVALSGPGIFGTGTNTEIWMADTRNPGFPISLGVIEYKVTAAGTCASNDTGTTVVGLGSSTNGLDLDQAPWDVDLDQYHNIYTIQYILDSGDPSSRVFCFPAYNPATNQGKPETNAIWAVGAGDDTYGGASGIAVSPDGTYVAVALWGVLAGNDYTNGNTRILSATNGAFVTELDLVPDTLDVVDSDCAWDAVGNVYFIHGHPDYVTPGVWRAFSPPGTNQATTVAPAIVQFGATVVTQPLITGITVSNGTVVITFTAGASDSASAFAILGAALAAGPYSAISGATIRQLSAGVFQASFSSSTAHQFYRVERVAALPPEITSISVSNGSVLVNFSGSASDLPSAFTLQSASAPKAAAFTDVAAAASQITAGHFQFGVPANGPSRFYRVRR
ncbi:conserved exported hypothetical protein [Verrucomicrobia bacterium]|nr:conserved exported hypothetical protein [Verrucomicrobiota bacterium]